MGVLCNAQPAAWSAGTIPITMTVAFTACLMVLAGGRASAAQTEWVIENESLVVRYDGENGTFTVAAQGEDAPFLTNGALAGTGECLSGTLAGQPFGVAECIRVAGEAGNIHRVMLFPGIPFVFFQSQLINSGKEDLRFERFNAMGAEVDLGVPSERVSALGTAGLTPPDGHPGSYSFLALADPETRRGVVAGWVTHDKGSGVLFSQREGEAVQLDARIDYGRLLIRPEAAAKTELLAVGLFDDARLGLEAYADCVAQAYHIDLPPVPSGYCTWYSNPHGGASDVEHMAELAEFCARELKPYGFEFIQIDDIWQGRPRQSRPLDTSTFTEDYLGKPADAKDKWWWGPHSDFTSHNPKGPYPDGMTGTASHLTGLGFTPGIWLMPFAWDPTCDALKNHQDWFVKQSDGSLYYAMWAGWCLDMTVPGAREFLSESIRRITQEWGYEYLKLDGLWTGMPASILYVNDPYKEDDLGQPVVRDPYQTPLKAYRRGLALVREAAGEDVFILGCNVSQNMRTMGASFGLVDAMRIGPDNGPEWGSLKTGPWHGSNRYFYHGRVWYNDPDPVYVRESMPLEHARLICSWAALTGQLTVASDWLPDLPEERLDILKRSMPNHGLTPRPVDLFENELPSIWHLMDARGDFRRDVVGLFNWDEKNPASFAWDPARIALPESVGGYHVFDFWANEFVDIADATSLEIPAGSCRILAVRPVEKHPVVLSTNRHVSQGAVSLRDERWVSQTKILGGTSSLVGGDPYEIRIAAPDDSWRAVSAKADADGVDVEVKQEKNHVRVTLRAPESKDVYWHVTFEN